LPAAAVVVFSGFEEGELPQAAVQNELGKGRSGGCAFVGLCREKQ